MAKLPIWGIDTRWDNDRLDMLQELINKFNQAKTPDQRAALDDIINYIVDDMRQVLLAPHNVWILWTVIFVLMVKHP